MTDLKCSVTSCASNTNSLCRLNSINVEGESAERKDETCCSSFSPESSSMTNSISFGNARPETEIRCSAYECQYNSDTKCSASYISVQGDHASDSEETRCETFKKR